MNSEPTGPRADRPTEPGIDEAQPPVEHFDAALTHVDESFAAGRLAAHAARGILYSIIETLGTLIGDPDLPEHARSGYEGLLETARELRAKTES